MVTTIKDIATMPFQKGDNGKKKRKVDDASFIVTPKKQSNDVDVLYGKLETMLELFEGERESVCDYDAIKYLETKIKEIGVSKEDIDYLHEKLNQTAEDRKQEALRLKNCLKEAGTDIVIDHLQEKFIIAIEKMNEEGLDNIADFINLARAKTNFVRHTSKKNHPEYKRDEIMMEAMSNLLNTDDESAYECEATYRTRIRVQSQSQSPSSSSSSSSSSSASSSAPPTMENITARGK